MSKVHHRKPARAMLSGRLPPLRSAEYFDRRRIAYNSYCSLLRCSNKVHHASAPGSAKPFNARSHSPYSAAARIGYSPHSEVALALRELGRIQQKLRIQRRVDSFPFQQMALCPVLDRHRPAVHDVRPLHKLAHCEKSAAEPGGEICARRYCSRDRAGSLARKSLMSPNTGQGSR
jgi:hypothetical protein